MNPNETDLLDEMKIFCPPEIVAKYSHKQNNPKEWTRFYYYKNKRRFIIPKDNIQYDYEVSSTLNYNKNVFYKMTSMSSSDGYFDYFFKLKDNLPNIVVKKSNRDGKSQRSTTIATKKYEPPETCPETGKFIVRFD